MPRAKIGRKITSHVKKTLKKKNKSAKEKNQYSAPARIKQIKRVKRERKRILSQI